MRVPMQRFTLAHFWELDKLLMGLFHFSCGSCRGKWDSLCGETHRASYCAGGMLVTAAIEAICTVVDLCAAVAIPPVALGASAEDLGILLGACGNLGTATIVLGAEIHHCKCREREHISHHHEEWAVTLTRSLGSPSILPAPP